MADIAAKLALAESNVDAAHAQVNCARARIEFEKASERQAILMAITGLTPDCEIRIQLQLAHARIQVAMSLLEEASYDLLDAEARLRMLPLQQERQENAARRNLLQAAADMQYQQLVAIQAIHPVAPQVAQQVPQAVPQVAPAGLPQYQMIYNHPPGAGQAVLALLPNAHQGPVVFFF